MLNLTKINCFNNRYDPKEDKVYPSTFRINIKETKPLGALFIGILRLFGLVQYKRVSDSPEVYECSNLTIINLALVKFGPMNEKHLTLCLLTLQTLCTGLAFFIRYGISKIFY